MMIKNECDIVKDLFPNYIEDQLNEGTKEFVDKHLKECSDCSNLLNKIKTENDIEEGNLQKKQIDFLKIYNIQMLIAKIIIVFLLCIIIPAGSIIGYRFIKGRKAYNIITEVCDKKEELLKESNFTIEENDNNITIRKLSIYNEYFKEEVQYKEKPIYSDFRDCIKYGMFHENTETIMFDILTNDKTISSASICGGNYIENQYKDIFNKLNSLSIRNKLNCYNIKVSEEKLKNNDCYVLEEANKYCIVKWYIDINTMLIKRFEKYGIDGELQRFCNYNYSVNTVKKEEAVMTERDGKLIINGLDEYKYNDSVWTKNLINEYMK